MNDETVQTFFSEASININSANFQDRYCTTQFNPLLSVGKYKDPKQFTSSTLVEKFLNEQSIQRQNKNKSITPKRCLGYSPNRKSSENDVSDHLVNTYIKAINRTSLNINFKDSSIHH